ncbi:flagellar hook-associated protein FlgK [Lacunimicrobium album]
MSLTSALTMAGRSLEIFSTGVQVAGQNISNSNTPGYVRESMILRSDRSYLKGGLLLGTGASVTGVQQQLDFYLETKIHTSKSDLATSSGKVDAYNQLETILSELGTGDLSTGLNQLSNALQELVNQPESSSLRSLVISAGDALAKQIQSVRTGVDRARTNTTEQVDALVQEANGLIDQVAQYNKDIVKLEAAGLLKSDAGGLRSLRLEAVNRLAEIMPIQAVERENGMIDLYTDTNVLVQGSTTQHFETYVSEDQNVVVNKLRIIESGAELDPTGGEIKGIIEGRDQVLGGFTKDLDQFTAGLIHTLNTLHSQGEGLVGHQNVTGTYGASSTTSTLNQSGLPFPVKHGQFEIKLVNKETGQEETTVINIDADGLGGNDTTLAGLQTTLDGLGNLTATLTTDGKLQLQAADGYEIRFSNDSSGALASLGINTFFQGTNSTNISVNQQIVDNPSLLATGKGGGDGDNTNIIQLAKFLETPSDVLGEIDVDQFYNNLVAGVATNSSTEKALKDGYTTFLSSLQSQRDQISGVSIDEETIKILQYQQSYQAAARIISTVDQLYQVLLNI